MSSYLFKNPVVPLSNIAGNYVNVDGSNWASGLGSNETSRSFSIPHSFSNNAAAANASRLAPMKGGLKKIHTLRRKIKNIINKYKMPSSKRTRKQTKRRLMSLCKKKSHYGKSRKMRHSCKYRHRGGKGTVLDAPIISSQVQNLQNGSNVYAPMSSGPIDSVNNPYAVNRMLGGRRRKGRKHVQKGGYNQFQSNIPNSPTFSTGGYLDAKNSALANPVPYQHLSNCTNCIDNYSYYKNGGFQFWDK